MIGENLKTHLVSFATENFYKSQNILNESSKSNGIDIVHSYSPNVIDSNFVEEHNDIINNFKNRGAGYWLFKPYIILDVMEKCDYGDYVIYVDSGINFINNINKILNHTNEDIILFSCHGHLNKTYTKRDCFYYMECDENEYINGNHTNAAIQIYKKTERSIKFVREYMHFCCDKRVITDVENVCGLSNYKEFVDHRHDQSVLSLLTIKNNIKTFRDPTQYGNQFDQNEYPQIFNHHRSRN